MADAETPNALGMSDDDFLKTDPTTFAVADEPADTSGDADEDTPEDVDTEDTDESDATDDAADEDPETGADDSADKDADPDSADKDPDVSAEEKSKEKAPAGELTVPQYADIGKQIMAEFKANGTSIKVKSAEDAIQLMQMGANYHKKMAGLKPSLKTLKLLENNDLLDPQKLNFLIDLSQKKPEAITQLLKDSKIDPMDIDLKGEENYVSENRTVNDTEIVLDEVLESISNTSSYNKTLNVLGDVWDDASRDTISKTPEIIRTINAHMENGIYDQVADAVTYERSMGKLMGVSDFDAYQTMGNHMHENKLFKTAAVTPSDKAKQSGTPAAPRKAANAAQEQQRQERKKAASPSRQKGSPKKDTGKFNPLEMSDEEFAKQTNMSI